VPAFIAVAYIMNYYKQQNIIPQACNFSLKTDTVLVNKYVSLGSVAQALDVELTELTILNPAYKKQIVNGTTTAPRRLVIPQIGKEKYGALYNALNNPNVIAATPQLSSAPYRESYDEKTPKYHKVKKGETLRDIADSYGIELQDLKAWNHLHNNRAAVGKKLKLSETTDEPEYRPSAKHNHNYITYKVKRGDTVSGIAAKFDGASVEKIRSLNGLKRGQLQPGMTIRINRG